MTQSQAAINSVTDIICTVTLTQYKHVLYHKMIIILKETDPTVIHMIKDEIHLLILQATPSIPEDMYLATNE
jgi:hypothetical protein